MGAGIAALVLLVMAASTLLGGASMSPSEIADCIIQQDDEFDTSSFETFTRGDLLDDDIEGEDDQREADIYRMTDGMTTVVGVYFYPVPDAGDAPDVADYVRDHEVDDVTIYGDDVVVVGPYLQDRTDAQLAALDAGFECIEGDSA